MWKLILYLLIILSASSAYAQEDWFYNSQNLIINLDVFSEAYINPTSPDYNVRYITVNLSHYPYESLNQKVINLEIEPEADIENNAMLFRWQNPRDKVSFGYNAKIKTDNEIVKIREKIKFPLIDFPEEVKQFTQSGEIIDSNDSDIVRLASKLVEGEDDLYAVVHKIAEWTKNNVDYNLSTLTAEASQKASWVLANRQGVCDELTSLFIAMLRAVGVPSKFISGIAYTNSPLFPENWGSHGWAEVYFPNYGWVPYDVTYGQFGYVDPTHIKLKESFDSAEPSVQYRWVARNIKLDTRKLDIGASLKETAGRVKKPISLDINVLKENIGFGSYNLIEAVLENSEDYYISAEAYISKPKEAELIGGNRKNILLKPNEMKSVFWIIKLTENLQEDFIYTFPITISTLWDLRGSTSFQSTKDNIVYTIEQINNVLQQKEEEEKKVYSKDIKINCSINKNEFYSYENAEVECKIRNIGNIFLNNLNFCINSKGCERFDLGIAQEKELNFFVESPQEGKQEIALNAESEDVSKAAYLEIDVLDKPEIEIKGIKAPNSVSFDDIFQIEFLLSKESNSEPKNVKITVANNFEKSWAIEKLSDDKKLIINLPGKDLRKGGNEININVKYEDKNGKKYATEESFSVELVNVSLIQSIQLLLIASARRLENASPEGLLLIVTLAVLVSITIIHIIFRRRK